MDRQRDCLTDRQTDRYIHLMASAHLSDENLEVSRSSAVEEGSRKCERGVASPEADVEAPWTAEAEANSRGEGGSSNSNLLVGFG